MRAAYPEMSEAVLLAFQAAEYWAAGQEDPPRGGPESGRYTYESDSHYGPGETSASTLSSKHSISSSNHGKLTGGGGSSGRWAGGRGSRHGSYGEGAHDSAGKGALPITPNDLPDPASQHNFPPYTHDTTHHVDAAPRSDTGDVDRQVQELSRTPDRQENSARVCETRTSILIAVPPIQFA